MRVPSARRFFGALALLTVTVLAGATAATATPPDRLKVCVVALNEPHELDVFRAHLDPDRFEFVDLGAGAAARALGAGDGASASWLLDACTPDATCDMVVYSAEFAGRFFGKRGLSLSLQELEEASCQARCAGLFHRPQEVFLLACNTLATKDEDSRTPDEYLRVLLDHGFDQASAERVVALRYGPLGPSFRESLRRIFAGVPRLYGFSSVAPRGEYTAPMLARYMRATPDYARVLERTAGEAHRNEALLAAFRGTALTQITGLTAAEAGAVDRDRICALYDEGRSDADRLRIAHTLLSRADALSFVPTVEVFLTRHPPASLSTDARHVFADIQELSGTRDTLLQLVRNLNVSALKLELAHFAVLTGWLGQAEFHAIATDGARQLLRQRLTSEVVDIMCEITRHESLRGDFAATDIPQTLYGDAEGLRLLACLAPTDPRVRPSLIAALGSDDPVVREWAAHTLTRLLPLDEATLEHLLPYLRDPSPEVATRVRWLFQAQGAISSDVLRAVRQRDAALGQALDAQGRAPRRL
ncbi:MAG: hypothetical protein U0807_03525 [Candidatus Binatia bacterium]